MASGSGGTEGGGGRRWLGKRERHRVKDLKCQEMKEIVLYKCSLGVQYVRDYIKSHCAAIIVMLLGLVRVKEGVQSVVEIM